MTDQESYNAFVLALRMCITASSDEGFEKSRPIIEELAAYLDEATIERAKADALAQIEEQGLDTLYALDERPPPLD